MVSILLKQIAAGLRTVTPGLRGGRGRGMPAPGRITLSAEISEGLIGVRVRILRWGRRAI
jgi:hypothetical protein